MQSTQETPHRYYTVEEVANVLRCSVSSVRWFLRVGRIKSIRPARRRLIPVEAVETFLAAGANR